MDNSHPGPATAATIEIRTSSNWRLKEQGTSYNASVEATALDGTEALVTSETASHLVHDLGTG